MDDAMAPSSTRPGAAPAWRLAAVDVLLLLSFFISGASALIYQVGWQRALYAQLGVDIDSITIIVSVFMLGIGIGGMLGGWAADRLPRRRLALYGAIECGIGAYGLASLQVLPAMIATLAPAGTGALASTAACVMFLLVPTVLMGMTLPLLTIAFDEWRTNIGVSVGTLYFTNTMGAAVGAAIVPFFLLPRWTLPEVIVTAAAGNVVAVACTLLAVMAVRGRA